MLLLDKPSGCSSNAALQSARRLFSAAKAGHTGTLDPLASGLLPLCFGEATKFSIDLLAADKTYEADLLFGANTDTGDAEGAVVRRRPVAFQLAELEAVLARFRGPLRQIPPMYSALKRDGRPLYELARQGVEVEREAREVTIHELILLDFAGDRCRLRVRCSKGTYIRALAEDIGNTLDCGAYLTALRRIAVGSLCVTGAVTLEQLTTQPEQDRARHLLSLDTLLQSLPAVHLDDADGLRFLHGNPVTVSADAGKYRVYGFSRLLGLGEVEDSGRLQPRRVVVAP
ncbi:MAG TPA: tRNA pseudouridine(55) synthase TruB [Accumulibacter sp.]|nr:tRNA pseudouridine(55) synthase TruB [Accumulibacter sp.]HQC79571.1 tRNA pseudouridine(55) synthase TruB [Accumulibacter sp.]